MDKIWIIILLIVHFVMTVNLFIYLFIDARKISKKEAFEVIPFLLTVSSIWLIYWCWFVYDDIKLSED